MSDNNDIFFRFSQPEDDQGIVELLTKTFPKWAKFEDPIKFWRWKYINTPLKTIITLSLKDDKIIGCNHSILFNAKIGDETTLLSWGDDLAVDNDYRGLGLWAKMREYKDKQLGMTAKYTYSTTVNPKVKQSWTNRKRNTFPFPVTRMVRINDVELHLKMRPMSNSFLVKTGYSYLKTSSKLINTFSARVKHNDDLRIAEIPKFGNGIDLLWEKIKDDYNFILEKKHEFLNWRFSSEGRGNHIFFQATEDEEVLGYLVIRLREEDDYTEGQIDDLIALNSRVDVAEALLDHACKYLDDRRINTAYYQVVENHPYHKVSKKMGFISSGSKPYINFSYTEAYSKKINQTEIPFLKHTSPSQVYFNYADTV